MSKQAVLTAAEPPPHNIDVEGIAPALIAINRWICWRWTKDKKGKWTKVPCDLHGGKMDAQDPANWIDFATAAHIAHNRDYGLGFVFNGDGINGVDLDDCRDPGTGAIDAWARDIITVLGSYTEVSPSGTGVKVFVRGEMPEKFRHQYDRPEGGSSEIYSRGRFFTVTGQRVPGTPDDVLDRPKKLATVLKFFQSWLPEPKPKKEQPAPRQNYPDGDDRATALRALDVLDPSVSYPQWLEIGMALYSVDSSASMLTEWENWSRVSDKFVEGECSKKWSSFGTGDITIGTLCHLADHTGQQWRPERKVDPGVNIDAIVAPPAPVPLPKPIIPAGLMAPGGLLEEILRFTLATAIKPQPELALAGAIALLATVMGRKVQDDYGTRPNCNAIGVGPSGCGKDHPRRVNKMALMATGGDQMFQDDLASDAGLHSALTMSPSTLVQMDEFGRFLAATGNPAKAPWLYKIITVLMKLYSSSGDVYAGPSYADAKRNVRIPFPNCVLFGTTVPQSFFASLTLESLSDGFFNRLLIFEVSNGDPDPQVPAPFDLPYSIEQSVRWWIAHNPGSSTLSSVYPVARRLIATDAANLKFAETSHVVRDQQRAEEKRGTQIWGRCYENARKMALIHQLSLDCEATTISRESAEWGCDLSLHLTNRIDQLAQEHISDGEFDAQVRKLLRFIRDAGNAGRTRTEVCRHMRAQNNRQLDELVMKLVSTEEIVSGKRPVKSGPEPLVYKAM